MKNSFSPWLFGEIGCHKGYLEKEKLDRALSIQEKNERHGRWKLLGAICLEEGFLNQEEIDQILEKQRERGHHSLAKQNRHYGIAAIDLDLVETEEIDRFFSAHRRDSQFPYQTLPHYLLHQNLITLEDHLKIIQNITSRPTPSQMREKKKRESRSLPYLPAGKEECLRLMGEKLENREKNLQPPKVKPHLLKILYKYELLDQLGKGGMGTVLLGRNRKTGQLVALKVLPSPKKDPLGFELGKEEIERNKRFLQEMGLLNSLRHPNIVEMIDAGADEGYIYCGMEYVRGMHLMDILELTPMSYLTERWALDIARQVCCGLGASWERKVVHRDIKGENILVSCQGEAKILDFGIARFSSSTPEESRITPRGIILGSPAYIPPEVIDPPPDDSIDVRTDFYSLGVLLFRLLSGFFPFEEESVNHLMICHVHKPAPYLQRRRPEVSKRTADLVRKMMAKDPSHRPPHTSKLIKEIDSIMAELPPDEEF